jgi:hypothetical protein
VARTRFFVVPAQAGTHTPRPYRLKALFDDFA